MHVRDIGHKSLSIDCGGVTFGMGDIIEDLSKSGIYASLMDWGRLYERWISYPVDKSYPADKSPIQWIAICRIKLRCTQHG